jgi:hypothetical protein
MKRTVQCAVLLVAFCCPPLVGSADFVVSIPADVQHFGPLLVVATHDDSPAPETYRGDLFSDKAEERMRLLRAIGIESISELRELWKAFLSDHGSEDQNKVISQFVSGGMLEWNFGEPGSKQVDLDAGFDETTDLPLELRAVFNQKDGHWVHLATLACRCPMTDDAEPFNLHPGRPLPPQEWVISLHQRTENPPAYRRREIRFRLRGNAMWPLIDFESESETCPHGSLYGPDCTVVITNLEPAKLIGEDNEFSLGFALISRSGKPPARDKAPLILYNPVCKPYTWSENSFSYVPSDLKPVNCGLPIAAPKGAATTNSR